MKFDKILDNIYRLKVPFENLYTSVFLIREPAGDILFDCATTRSDAEDIIIPACIELGSTPKHIVCCHSHGDHMGGLPHILSHFTEARAAFMDKDCAEKNPSFNAHVLSDGEMITEHVKAISLPGHSEDSMGLLDTRTSTLLSGDCIQLGGVSRYGTGVSNAKAYFASLERVENSDIENLIASHEFYPLGALALGRSKLEEYISESRNIALEIRDFAAKYRDIDCDEIAKLYNSTYSPRPPISGQTVKVLSLQ